MTTKAGTHEPFVFLRRGRNWTLVYFEGNRRKQKALKGLIGLEKEAKARKALALFIERQKTTQIIEGNEAGDGPMTVARWATTWLRTREAKGIATVDDYRSRLTNHILPHIGDVRLDKVTPEHIAEVMRIAAASGTLAPRSQRHVYGTMHAMFARAVPRLLERNPCSIHPDELPKKKDADPEWRPKAIFSREEVQALITSPQIPSDRRTFYGVMFLAGLRFGEVAALKVRHYRTETEPLGQLQVGLSYNSKKGKLKGVKTDRPRLVPVHPWLEQLLGWWLAVGWEEMMGRPPEADDVLIPTRLGGHRSCSTGWRQMNGGKARKDREGREGKWAATPGDLGLLGLRPRRQHDTRRTFITLARADGAAKDLLRLVTHGPEGDIVDIYTEMPWGPLCAEVAKLKLAPPAPKPLGVVPNPTNSLEPGLPSGCHGEILQPKEVVMMRPQRDSNPDVGHGQGTPPAATGSNPAPALGRLGIERQAAPASDGHSWPMATLATLALRQALAALRKGRVDQATEIIERAVADEATEARRVDGGRS
jgi:integrase